MWFLGSQKRKRKVNAFQRLNPYFIACIPSNQSKLVENGTFAFNKHKANVKHSAALEIHRGTLNIFPLQFLCVYSEEQTHT